MMNEQYLLDSLITDCNQLNDSLKDEYLKLNQELQEMYANNNISPDNNTNDKVMFNPYPTPVEAPMDIDENLLNALSSYNEFPDSNQTLLAMAHNSSTIDPISVSNGVNNDLEMNEELLSMMMANFIENAPLGNDCNEIDFDDLNQNLLSIQKNSVNNTIPMDESIESIIANFKNNGVSFLETAYSDINGNMSNKHSLENVVSES